MKMDRSNNIGILRRSERISMKSVESSRVKEMSKCDSERPYMEHIETLHGISGDLLMMMDTLDVESLRNIISEYEIIVGELLGIKR